MTTISLCLDTKDCVEYGRLITYSLRDFISGGIKIRSLKIDAEKHINLYLVPDSVQNGCIAMLVS